MAENPQSAKQGVFPSRSVVPLPAGKVNLRNPLTAALRFRSCTTIVNESGTRRVTLSGVFSDADGDRLTLSAASSDNMVVEAAIADDALTVLRPG